MLLSEFQLDQLHRNDGEKGARTGRRAQDRGTVKADNDALGLTCLDKFFDCAESGCVVGLLKASSRQVGLSGRLDASTNQNSSPDAAPSTQGLQRGAQLFISIGKLVATGKDQKSLNRQEESVISTRKLVATEYQGYSGNPEIPEGSEGSKPQSRI